MERVYTNYWASGQQVVLLDVPEKFSAITVENVRVIINETQKKVLASSMKKANISNVVYSSSDHRVTITLDDSTPSITSGDKLTIKIDMGDDLRDRAGSCIIEDIIDMGLPADQESGFSAILDDGDFIIEDGLGPGSEHADEYKIGDIIKPTIQDESAGDLTVAKTVTATSTDLRYDDENHIVSGITGYIQWKANHYYRVTGIYEVYDNNGIEVVMHIFTYEEIEPEDITGLLKQATDKIAATAGNLIMATESERTAALADLSSRINALNTNQGES